ncbi:hypothetical protein [Ammoniphilus sp. YIM 78166]|uniref:hypothetical protein n=1 Tax=Ammoniphilus sp. YIM 78166 TaxID=1644106 RepID=UPI0014322945|nr:hypothetical protein [Ammoniphilus sp. YIM 78166]
MEKGKGSTKLTDNQQLYAKNYLGNQAQSTDRALDAEIYLDQSESRLMNEEE